MHEKAVEVEEQRQFDVLQETRDFVAKMTQAERFHKARRHLMDALSFRHARNDPDTNDSWVFNIAYTIQTSSYWNNFLFIMSIVYMYLIVAEPNNRLDLGVKLNSAAFGLDVTILILMCLDIIFEIIHKVSWSASFSKKYPFRFWAKVFFVSLFIIDSIVFYTKFTTYPLRPFRILRAFLPYFYDYFSRKALHSLYNAGKDIIVYLIFYTIVIMTFGIIATQIIDLPPGTPYDQFNANYYDLGTMSFLIYVLASYDAWPDYQILAVTAGSNWYYVFFVAFIFLNCFYFVTIPTTVIFASFKSSRSKLVLIDQIKQQNSLLLCFVTLGERNLTIKSETFHQFMLYVYKNKLRLIDHIKELSYKLDPNNNSIIFVSDFMKLSKLMEEDYHMMPPKFNDWGAFIKVRKWLCKKLYLKKIATSDIFDIVVILVIIINFIIIMVSFFHAVAGYETIEVVLLAFYTVQLFIRLFGEGPEKFAGDERNWVDTGLLLISLALMSDNSDTNLTLRKVARLIRLFRINRIVRIFWRNQFFRKKIYLSSLYQRLRLLFNQLYICSIVGLKMFPLFMTFFYVLSIIGMERFDNRFGGVASSSPYSLYDKVSNFRSLVESHLVWVQVMIEAGWSPIVYDYAYRYNSFGESVIFFVASHAIIVIILVSLMKGMAADFYETIYNRYQEILQYELGLLQKEEIEEEKKKEFEEIRAIFMAGKKLPQDTVKKKEIRQAKMNREIIDALKTMIREKELRSPTKKGKSLRTVIIGQNASAKDLFKQKKSMAINHSLLRNEAVTESQINLDIGNIHSQERVDGSMVEDPRELLSLCDEDIDQLEDEFVDKVTLKEEDMPFSTTPFYPTFLKDFIKRRLIPVKKRKVQISENQQLFNLNKEKVGDSRAITGFYTTALQNLLHIEKPEEQRKKQILQDILKLKFVNEDDIAKRIAKKYKHEKTVQIDQIIKRVYLSNTNQSMVQKFKVEYFSDIYGNSFKEMSRVTIQPILRHEALLLDVMAKVMRYPEIQTSDFFHILATIEYKISNSLVKKGSIFKFVFQVEELAGNWFAIEVKENKELRLHFLKTSIWIYDKSMVDDEIYYGHDLFWFNKDEHPGYDVASCKKIIKLLYGAFESLAFSMLNETNFFKSDPADSQYDIYTVVIPSNKKPVQNPRAFNQGEFNLKISKVMLVILSKENERPKNKRLDYELTNLKAILEEKKKKKTTEDFKFDDAENETFEKLKNLAAEDEEKIAESEGLPYSFLVDMIKSVQNILKLDKDTLIQKAQQVLNREFNKDIKMESISHSSAIGSRNELF